MITRINSGFPTLLLFLLCCIPAFAQRLTVATIDTSTYPVMRARIYLLDNDGKPIRDLSAADFRLSENGTSREVLSINCPSPPSPDAISSVLTVDVSGSMASGKGGVSNIVLARAAATAWVEALPPGQSECAITSFDDRGQINSDLTQDRDRLRGAINQLTPQGGTDYNAGLLNPPAGGLAIAAAGTKKRVIVFLTDGLGRGDEDAIVAEAQRTETTIYCVTLGMPAPPVLKNIAQRSGGLYFENVTTVEEAQSIYRAILYQAQGGEPCEITWRSTADCERHNDLTIAIPSRSMTASLTYPAPMASFFRLDIDPPSLAFGPATGGSKEMQVTLTALNRPITVRSIQLTSSGASSFTITNAVTPFTLAAGEKKTLTVRFSPSGNSYTSARWRIESDACIGTSLFASGGTGAKEEPSIKITRPNGGERFMAGEETTITWEGVTASDTVRLDYSTDNGATWRTVADRTTGLSYRWKVPATPSERCLARVAELGSGKREQPKGRNSPFVFTTTSVYNRDGSLIASASWDGNVTLRDGMTGDVVRSIGTGLETRSNEPERAHYAEFSPDGSRVLLSAAAYETQIRDVANGKLVATMPHTRPVNKQSGAGTGELQTAHPVFSPDGSVVLLRDASTGIPALWSVRSGKKLHDLTGHEGWVLMAIFSPNGKTIATSGSDSIVRLWDATTGRQTRLLKLSGEFVNSIDFSPDGNYILATTNGRDTVNGRIKAVGIVQIWKSNGDPVQTIKAQLSPAALFSPDNNSLIVWGTANASSGTGNIPTFYDIRSGEKTHEIERYRRNGLKGFESIEHVVFSPDGRRVALVNADVFTGTIDVFDAVNGAQIDQLPLRSVVGWAAFSPDGERIAGTVNNDVKVWQIGAGTLQEDRSDALWAIIESKPVAIDVDFGKRPVGTAIDSVFTGYIRNDGNAPLTVDAIRISGANGSDFSIVSNTPFEIAPGGRQAVEFGFKPGASGRREGSVEIDAGGKTLRPSIRGEGVLPQLQLAASIIDFDTLLVGTTRDTTVDVVLRNAGSSAVNVSTASIIGPDTSQFEIVRGGKSFSVPAGGSYGMTIRFKPTRTGRTSTRISFSYAGLGSPISAQIYGEGVVPGEKFTDPTTFRTVAVPNAIIPKQGTIVVGTYDLFGLMAGYSVTDNIMILAGGGVPLPDDWGGVNGSMYGAYSIGFKAGLPLTNRFNIALGYQWGTSIYDQDVTPDALESRISFHTPYASLSYGDDDSRISATFGYAFKNHVTIGEEFARDAIVLGVGGDYRIANRWKLGAELLTMQTLGYVPIIAEARYFGKGYAFDFGLAYLGIVTGEDPAPKIPLAPLITYIIVL